MGFNTNDHIHYKDYPVSEKLRGIGAEFCKRLSYTSENNGDRIYLYNNGCNPVNSKANMDAYLKKLEILSKLGIVR